MTAHIAKPFVHVEDSNGNPYVAAKLYVYDYGTTNLKTIYSNEGLSVSVTNPLTSNASGDFDRVYIPSVKYKLRAETAAAALIWEIDNIDPGLTSGSGALAISAGGTSATTAAAARTALGAAAQTDVDDLASDIATINASLTNITAIPQGYLTPTSGTPVIASGTTAGATVYYTPFVGNLCPIYSGSSMVVTEFTELTLSLVASHVASAIYDCFVINDSGTVRLVTGPAWNTPTAGSGARGTGAGTTELNRTVGGIWTNANSMTARYGATTVTVDANKGTYVGSIHMDGTNAQLSCLIAYGSSRKFGIWNAYNRQKRILRAGDGTASWNMNSVTIRASRNDAGNCCYVFSGLAEETYIARFQQVVEPADGGSTSACVLNIGFNSTTVASGTAGTFGAQAASYFGTPMAQYTAPPSLGIQVFTALESVTIAGGAANQTFYGTESNMLLTVEWRG
jgi:hypothetical protein